MIAVLQRVSSASVSISNQLHAQIGAGLVILLGVAADDTADDIAWLVQKVANLRIFSDAEGKMNHSLIDKAGNALVVSQFTLLASTRKGTRPSFIKAGKPESAVLLYEQFVMSLQQLLTSEVKTGQFGADMQVALINDGPVTILLDTKNKN